jgi:hypothetical protein
MAKDKKISLLSPFLRNLESRLKGFRDTLILSAPFSLMISNGFYNTIDHAIKTLTLQAHCHTFSTQTETFMQISPDYGRPLYFLTGMTVLAILGYQFEPLLGMGAVFTFSIWALIILYYLNKVSKNQLPFAHPTTFFTILLVITVTGSYIHSYLNAESFMLLFAWLLVVLGSNSLTKCPAMNKQVFNLLAVQFLGIACVMPALLNYVNIGILDVCVKTAHTSAQTVSLIVLKDLINLVVIVSLLVAWKMWKEAGCNRTSDICDVCC